MRWVGFRRLANNSADYIAYRHALAHAVLMGTHGRKTTPEPLPPRAALRQITFHCWPVAGRTMISAVGVYEVDGETTRHNIGADILDYDALSLPVLTQVVYALGDEIRAACRELSHPKR